MTNKTELLPCPFCNAEPHQYPSAKGVSDAVTCTTANCPCDQVVCGVNEWNTRAASADKPEMPNEYSALTYKDLAERLAHYLSSALVSAQYSMTDETMHDALGLCDQVRRRKAAPAEDVRAVVEERTPQDYAIEHAGFLATAADQVLADYQAYSLAQMLANEGGDDGEAELTDAIDEARDDLHEGLRNLREMTYQFRKRRARATPQ